ncbi:TetR/AcrR family transcriptional regulator [Allokutzneria albata]|uniref:DNA-binding transcriptional regulator, AcrR family n=1 Tax=Allokutzneria albata TaxID=211114 RepID=A0A1G9UZ19_ALLAB|nr:TetR/AcrR family transcriptional regulator [Allokutzneria albata]SDM65158.1 DNA-binding transcriptional regulator, AcrR family [Allokutzneria albata]
MSGAVGEARRGGRTRSDSAHTAVLTAAADLLEESGYGKLSIEGIAARSGVAKSTIYRWWRSKGELVMEAYTQVTARRVPDPDTGAVEKDLLVFLDMLYRANAVPRRARVLRGLMAEAQLDDGFRSAFQEWIQGHRTLMAAILRRGVERGELAADLDVEYAVDQVFGPFWYRLLVGHIDLDPAEVPRHVEQLLRGARP